MIQECSWFCERDSCSLGLLYSFKIAFIFSVGREAFVPQHRCEGQRKFSVHSLFLPGGTWRSNLSGQTWQQETLYLLRYPIGPGHFVFLEISLKTSFCAQLFLNSCSFPVIPFFFRRHKLYWKTWLKVIIYNPSLFCFSFESWEPLKFIF